MLNGIRGLNTRGFHKELAKLILSQAWNLAGKISFIGVEGLNVDSIETHVKTFNYGLIQTGTQLIQIEM
jgi:hypothetical protein